MRLSDAELKAAIDLYADRASLEDRAAATAAFEALAAGPGDALARVAAAARLCTGLIDNMEKLGRFGEPDANGELQLPS
jgi:hypothetical protein